MYVCISSGKKGVRINRTIEIPEGQEYAPRTEPTAPIRLADRNHANYPSRQRTILKKKKKKKYIYIYIYESFKYLFQMVEDIILIIINNNLY